MTKRTRKFDAVASLGVPLAAPLLAVALVASCGDGGVMSSGGNMGGSSTSSQGGSGGGGGAGGTTTSMSSSASTSNSTGTFAPACTSDQDCAKDPNGHAICDTSTGYCVGCLPSNDTCAKGQYCEPATNVCTAGCGDNDDCDTATPHCDTAVHACVGCLNDDNCDPGFICSQSLRSCITGCTAAHACQEGATCCGDTCYNLNININHCGDCTTKCVPPANAAAACIDGVCGLGACDSAYADCNGDSTDGCEHNILQDDACSCMPGATQDCYQGLPNTIGVGACKGGTRTCKADGTGYGLCVGQVLPSPEICANKIDDDCNGKIDDIVDLDGDGWTICNGDCCEVPGPGCANPKLVNPGAFEVVDNGADDDCDPSTSDKLPPNCSEGEDFTGVTATDVAKAMDICQTTSTTAPIEQKRWGLITAVQLLANGGTPNAAALGDMQNKQTAILTHYGTGGIKPKPNNIGKDGKVLPRPNTNLTVAGLSTGMMRDQTAADYAGRSTELNTAGLPPAAYLVPHGGQLPSAAGCSGNCPAGSGANDSVNVRLTIRVPTNAKGFSYDFRFLSSEYWDFQCTEFNDFFLALLKTSWLPNPNANPPELPLPIDKNISFDSKKNPISVNNGFFDVCTAKGCNTCTSGSSELAGTGMQINNAGGGTSWLTTDAPVVPGEVMQIDLMIFDVTDHQLDSVVLLDNFRWNEQLTVVGTHK